MKALANLLRSIADKIDSPSSHTTGTWVDCSGPKGSEKLTVFSIATNNHQYQAEPPPGI